MSDENIQKALCDIDNICCIYRSVGEAMYDEVRVRLAGRFGKRLDDLTARLAAAEDLLREDLQGTGHTPSWWSRLSKALQHQEVKGGEMRDTDREQIERGIASIGYFDVENCTCDASVGFYPCHYCAEREAILAGRRVLERLAAAEAALKPFAEVARGIPDNWPGECHLRIDGEPVQLGDFIGCREWLCYHGVQDVQDACLPTIEQWREAAKAGGRDGRRM